jgi:hypothetical protein
VAEPLPRRDREGGHAAHSARRRQRSPAALRAMPHPSKRTPVSHWSRTARPTTGRVKRPIARYTTRYTSRTATGADEARTGSAPTVRNTNPRTCRRLPVGGMGTRQRLGVRRKRHARADVDARD